MLATTGVACQPGSGDANATSPTTTASADPGSHPPSGSVTVARLPGAQPVEREAAAILAAFDPESANVLATALPSDLDWSTTGVICVYLGRRTDGGWGLAIQGASLVDGELQVRARETRPVAGVDQPGTTFPADCATIDRLALPTGTLPARADDTVSDEFIVAGDLVVPAP